MRHARLSLFLATLGCVALGSRAANATRETLVVRSGQGYAPGAATSWAKAPGGGIAFQLAAGVEGKAIATMLSERLAGATVVLEGSTLTITGIPEPALLEQLCHIGAPQHDPLVDLANLGVAVAAADVAEGGGSIRAAKAMAQSQPWLEPIDHPLSERLEAQVVAVTRGRFPSVQLQLRVRRTPKSGPLVAQLGRGKVFQADVLTMVVNDRTSKQGAINVQNLVAYYVEPGDRVMVHVTPREGELLVDWIDRATTRLQ